jgi:hypothetical protein
VSNLLACYDPNTTGCDIEGCRSMLEGVSAYPVIELVVDGSDASYRACALCVAESWERVTGWRFVNLLASMRMGSEIGKLTRATNKEARRGRRTKTKGGDGLVTGEITDAAAELLEGAPEEAQEVRPLPVVGDRD